MRILYVMTDADIGGAEVVVETLGRSLQPGDSAELAILMGRGSMSDRLEAAFDRVHYLDFAYSSRDLPGMIRALQRVCRSFEPEVIHSHLFHADLVTILLPYSKGAKVSTIHTQGFSKADHILTRIIARVVGFLSFRFDAVVPTGEACLQFGESYHYRRLSTPINNTAPIPPEHNYNPGSTMVLSLARWHPVKGHLVLFNAYRRLLEAHPDWTLTCVGPGASEDNPDTVQAVKTAGLQEAFDDGRLQLRGPTENVAAVLAEAGVLVISSLYGETFPVVGVEANAAGVPVIATKVGECAQFVASPDHLVPPGDAEALAKSLQNFAGLGESERAGLSKLVRTRAENDFNPDTAARKYREIYEEILASRRNH